MRSIEGLIRYIPYMTINTVPPIVVADWVVMLAFFGVPVVVSTLLTYTLRRRLR